MTIIHLGPGDVAIGRQGDELHTVLGSCIALILWAPHRRVAAMAHIALPPMDELEKPEAQPDTRRADHAWQHMCAALARRGIDPASCVCKVFGGARVFDSRMARVGEKNIAAVRQLLHAHRIDVTSAHLGGTGYRELHLNVDTGEAWMRHRKGYVSRVLEGGRA